MIKNTLSKANKYISSIAITLLFPSMTFAAKIVPYDTSGQTTLTPYLTRTKNYLLGFAGSVAILFIIIGGVKLITSGGNTQRLDSAKKTLTYAIYGLLAVILASVILGVIMGDFLPAVFNGTVDPY